MLSKMINQLFVYKVMHRNKSTLHHVIGLHSWTFSARRHTASQYWALEHATRLKNMHTFNNTSFEGDTPLPLAYCPILAVRSAYRYFLASRIAYRLTTKNHF